MSNRRYPSQKSLAPSSPIHSKMPQITLPPLNTHCSNSPYYSPHRQQHGTSQPDRYLQLENYQIHKPSSINASSACNNAPTTPMFNQGFPSQFPSSPDSPLEPLGHFHHSSQKKPQRDSLRYSLNVYQQPCHARMVGNGEKADRRPIDPPPVLRLEVFDTSQPNQSSVHLTLLRSPYFVCYSTLCQSNPPYEELYVTPHSGKPYMVGNIVSSTSHVREDNPVVPTGHYFLFSDLGVRVEGCYRLKFSVFEIVDEKVFLCATAMSEEFEVFPPKRFPGMKKPTDISSALSRQGIRMRLRNKGTLEPSPVIDKSNQSEVVDKKMRKRKSLANSDKPGSLVRPVHKPTQPLKNEPQVQLSYNIPILPKIKMGGEAKNRRILPSIHSMLNFNEYECAKTNSQYSEEEKRTNSR